MASTSRERKSLPCRRSSSSDFYTIPSPRLSFVSPLNPGPVGLGLRIVQRSRGAGGLTYTRLSVRSSLDSSWVVNWTSCRRLFMRGLLTSSAHSASLCPCRNKDLLLSVPRFSPIAFRVPHTGTREQLKIFHTVLTQSFYRPPCERSAGTNTESLNDL